MEMIYISNVGWELVWVMDNLVVMFIQFLLLNWDDVIIW